MVSQSQAGRAIAAQEQEHPVKKRLIKQPPRGRNRRQSVRSDAGFELI
jgi:hypothetical protein